MFMEYMVEAMTEKERFNYRIRKETTQYEIYDNLKTGEYPSIEPFFYKHSAKKMCEFLNRQEEEIQELKQRNQRQYNQLKELTDLMFKRDWETLNNMVEEWEKEEEQLQKYGG